MRLIDILKERQIERDRLIEILKERQIEREID